MSNIYQFVVFHTSIVPTTQTNYARHWQSTYTYNNPEPVRHELLVEYAGRILFAERCIYDAFSHFIKIVCYQVRDGKPYDADTITHTIMNYWDSSQYYPNTIGLRPDGCRDAFVALRVKRNREIGRCAVEEYPATFGYYDQVRGLKREPVNHAPILGMDRGLATQYFPVFKAVLESLTGEAQDYEIDRFGNRKELPKLESGRIMSTVTNHIRQRSHFLRASLQEQWFRDAIYTASNHAQLGLYYYSEAMAGFNHTWGDGNVPPLEHCMCEFLGAAAIWKPLAEAIGYGYPANYTQQPISPFVTAQPFIYFPAKSMKLKQAHAQVFSCVKMLYACHQWVVENYPKYYNVDATFKYLHNVQSITTAQHKAQAKAFYDDYDNLIAVLFKITDCINVLQRIVLVANPKKSYVPFPHINHPLFFVYDHPQQQPLQGVNVPPWIGYFPIDKDPFVTTPKKHQVIIETVIEKPIGGQDTIHGPDHDHSSETDEITRQYNEKLQAVIQPLKNLKRNVLKARDEVVETIRNAADKIDDAFTSIGL